MPARNFATLTATRMGPMRRIRITLASIVVDNQDDALALYADALGLVKNQDIACHPSLEFCNECTLGSIETDGTPFHEEKRRVSGRGGGRAR